MTFCTAHRRQYRAPMLPSQIAVTTPRRRAPVVAEKPRQIYTDWASI